MTITVPKTNANPDGDPNGPLDVWLRFENDGDEEASHEANTYYNDDMGQFTVKWYNTAVGLVSRATFHSHHDAQEWLESNGFIDYTVKEN